MSFNQLSSHDNPGVAADSLFANHSLQNMSRRQIMRRGIKLQESPGSHPPTCLEVLRPMRLRSILT